MPLLILLRLVLEVVVEFAIWFFVFICFCGLKFNKVHVAVTFFVCVLSICAIYMAFPHTSATQLISTMILTGLLITLAYLKIKKIRLSIFFAAFSVLILLISSMVSFFILSFIMGSSSNYLSTESTFLNIQITFLKIEWFILLLVGTTVLAFTITWFFGKIYKKHIESLDETTKHKLHGYLAVFTVFALSAFFVDILRDVFLKSNLYTWAWLAGLLIVCSIFAALCFAIFALIKYNAKEVDLREKKEILENMSERTRNLENIVADIQKENILEIKLAESAGSHVKGSLVRLNTTDILYIESAAAIPHHIYVHTTENGYVTRMSLKEAEKKIGPGFTRCHKSYIVNKNAIASINPAERKLTLSSGQVIDVRRKYLIEMATSG